MSTICEIDPMVRITRTTRMETLRELAEVIRKLPPGQQHVRALFYHAALTDIHDSPVHTGEEKNESFAFVINQIQQESQHGKSNHAVR